MRKEFYLHHYQTIKGVVYEKIPISYQLFGQPLHTAPIVLVNHALTGNSDVMEWWSGLIGDKKVIDTQKYTIIAFDLVGNGQNGFFVENYRDFVAKDMAIVILKILQKLNISKLYAAIGGSLGGGIAWELAAVAPTLISKLIPIAAHWQSSDWIIGQNYVQECLLLHSNKPLEDARKMAMLFYRTPASLTEKFGRTQVVNNGQYNINSWLEHHGNKLSKRFSKKAYLMMNHLLSTIDIAPFGNLEEVLNSIQATVIQIAIDSDLLFVKEDNKATHMTLKKLGKRAVYHEIKSIHGHDAFLIEYQQLTTFLQPYFK